MKIKLVRGLWGMQEHNLESNLIKIKEGGFDAVEMGAPSNSGELLSLKGILKDLNLEFIGQQWTQHSTSNHVEEHIESFRSQFLRNKEAGALMVNSHTGKDHFSIEDNLKIFEAAEQIAKDEGVKLIHEIHRGRATFCTQQWSAIVDDMPNLRFTADFSHWCCVHESFLQDQVKVMERAFQSCDYIHARVGHSQGPQITDPRAPEWKEALDIHLGWWDAIVDLKRKQGEETFYICPEFGPYPYMTHLPLGNVPITDLWEVNHYMKELLQHRYQ